MGAGKPNNRLRGGVAPIRRYPARGSAGELQPIEAWRRLRPVDFRCCSGFAPLLSIIGAVLARRPHAPQLRAVGWVAGGNGQRAGTQSANPRRATQHAFRRYWVAKLGRLARPMSYYRAGALRRAGGKRRRRRGACPPYGAHPPILDIRTLFHHCDGHNGNKRKK